MTTTTAILIRGAHIMLCNLDELITSLLCCCFLYEIIDQFHNICNIFFFTWFHTTIFIPCDKMSGKGDGTSASSVDLSRRDFRAMMYYDYCQGKSCQDCFQNLKLFWRSIAAQSHCFQVVQTVHVWSENVGRRWPLWSNGTDCYSRKRL